MKPIAIAVVILSILCLNLIFILVSQSKQINKLNNNATIVYCGDSIKGFIPIIQPERSVGFVTVKIKGKKATFLLDTGASTTVVDINRGDEYGLIFIGTNSAFIGIGGQNQIFESINGSIIEVGNKRYYINFAGADLTGIVKAFQQNRGVDMVGILGSDFLERYGAVIDYDQNILFLTK